MPRFVCFLTQPDNTSEQREVWINPDTVSFVERHIVPNKINPALDSVEDGTLIHGPASEPIAVYPQISAVLSKLQGNNDIDGLSDEDEV